MTGGAGHHLTRAHGRLRAQSEQQRKNAEAVARDLAALQSAPATIPDDRPVTK